MRKLLGIEPSFGNFSLHSDEVFFAFAERLDGAFPTQHYIASLLERGVRVLLYQGVNDLLCNWVRMLFPSRTTRCDQSGTQQVGNEKMTLALEWTGRDAFISQPLKEWTVNGHVVGMERGANGLEFATVNHAGHLVWLLPCR